MSKLYKIFRNAKTLLKKIKNKILPYKTDAKGVSIAHNVELQNVDFGDYVSVAHHTQITDATIGKRTAIGRYNKIRSVMIGSYTSISWDVTIGAVGHSLNSISTSSIFARKQYGIVNDDIQSNSDKITKIGNDVWIGCGAIVLSGITIGDGAIIGAGAVVTKDVKPYEIVGGVPAKHIRYRFDEEVINKIIEINWVDWSDEKLMLNKDLFENELTLTKLENIKE